MSVYTTNNTNTQNELLMKKLMEFYTLPFHSNSFNCQYEDLNFQPENKNDLMTKNINVESNEDTDSLFFPNEIENLYCIRQKTNEEEDTGIQIAKSNEEKLKKQIIKSEYRENPSTFYNTEYQACSVIVDNSILQKISQNLIKMMRIINGDENISLRIVDWFVTNYAKKYYTVYDIIKKNEKCRFKVYNDYKLKLKAYSKRRFDVFCRWERIKINYDVNKYMETTIGQLNFFKWAIENDIIKYISENYKSIEDDMNERNNSKKNNSNSSIESLGNSKTRKKREELSESACKSIKKEFVNIVVKFN